MALTDTVRMRKDIHLVSASAIMTGIVIGSGIFVSPVSFIRNCGSVAMALIMWVLSGILSLGVALSFNELGGMFPQSGGDYVFLRETLGLLPAFLNSWCHFVVIQSSFQALLAVTTVDYFVQAVFPDNCGVPEVAQKLFAVWIIVTFVAINSVYVKYVTRVQTLLTAIKVAALALIIITGIVKLAQGRTEVLQMGFEGTSTDLSKHATALQSGVFTYMGWQYVFCLMEEVDKPEKIVPRATIISTLTVTVLYTLTNVAYFTVMTPQEMMNSKAVALTFAEKTLGRASLIIPFLVACSTIGALNGAILGGSRYYYAAARDGIFPSLMSTVHHKYLTPWPSLFAVMLLVIMYIVTGEAVALVEYQGFAMTTLMFCTVTCLIWLRWRRPDIPRPIKVPLALPVMCSLFMGSMLLLGVYQNPRANGIAVLLIASGVPVYMVCVLWSRHIACYRRIVERWTVRVQKCLLVVPTDKGF